MAMFKIENGILAMTLVDTGAAGYLAAWNTPGGLGIEAVTLAAYYGATLEGGDFTCQVTAGALTASPNTTDETLAASFCEPEVTITNVGVTSYTLDVTFRQDPHIVAGLSRFLFEHDTKEAFFILGLAGPGHTAEAPLAGTTVPNPPKAAGRVRLISGAIGGEARVTLTADLSLPVQQKPSIEFGNATTSEVVGSPLMVEGQGAPEDEYAGV